MKETEAVPLAVTIKTAAHMLDCSPEFVHKLLREGRLTRVKLGTATRVSVDELRSFVAAGGTRDKGCYPNVADQGSGNFAAGPAA